MRLNSLVGQAEHISWGGLDLARGIIRGRTRRCGLYNHGLLELQGVRNPAAEAPLHERCKCDCFPTPGLQTRHGHGVHLLDRSKGRSLRRVPAGTTPFRLTTSTRNITCTSIPVPTRPREAVKMPEMRRQLCTPQQVQTDTSPSTSCSPGPKADVSTSQWHFRHHTAFESLTVDGWTDLAITTSRSLPDPTATHTHMHSGAYHVRTAPQLGSIKMLTDGTAGDYTLVVSAFEPRHIGKFALRLECSDRFDITPIQQEGAGMFSKVVRGEWCDADYWHRRRPRTLTLTHLPTPQDRRVRRRRSELREVHIEPHVRA